MIESPEPAGDARFFSHEAMRTTFSLRFRGVDGADARAMARECFELIDSLEARLSRYIEGSDIWRINHLGAGEMLYLSEACHRCLLLGMEAYQLTGGLFDITLGRRIECRKTGREEGGVERSGRLIVHPDVPAVTCEEPGREIDLGGIGKGFALDEAARLLGEWGVEHALLAAGASSLLALGPQEWPVDLAGDGETQRITLCNESLSASGTGVQGNHILHPGGDACLPGRPCKRVWVTAATAVMAEVWSTTLMLVPVDEMAAWHSGPDAPRRVFVDFEGLLREIPEGNAG